MKTTKDGGPAGGVLPGTPAGEADKGPGIVPGTPSEAREPRDQPRRGDVDRPGESTPADSGRSRRG